MDENSGNVQPQPSEAPLKQPAASCPAKVEDKNVCNIALYLTARVFACNTFLKV